MNNPLRLLQDNAVILASVIDPESCSLVAALANKPVILYAIQEESWCKGITFLPWSDPPPTTELEIKPLILIYQGSHYYGVVLEEFPGVAGLEWPDVTLEPIFGTSNEWMSMINNFLNDGAKLKYCFASQDEGMMLYDANI